MLFGVRRPLSKQLIQMVRKGCTRQEVERLRCEVCGSNCRAFFCPDLTAFVVLCSRDDSHLFAIGSSVDVKKMEWWYDCIQAEGWME